MEELLVYAILLYQNIITEEMYQKRLNELFLKDIENEIFLKLEWETDINKAIIYIRTHINYQNINHEEFGKSLMEVLKKYYECCTSIEQFSEKMYLLWKSLPGEIQDKQPFFTLSYADDPLSWEDEKQTRFIYENMLNYYL
ncbi:MAG: hypothetical protein HFE57_04795 [Firmicutes bacterium]|jgi:hypothetical protein|nr:hypothetical protein [Bacillota bacterium]